MKISVIIPVYNKNKYIEQILNDVKTQSFSEYECLLIDDGSTDGSEKVCDRFVQLDSRFKVFHICNQGVSHARNVGLKNATGEFITFVDSDDRLHKDYLLNLYDCIIKNDVDLVIGCYTKIWDINTEKEEVVYSELTGKHSINEIYESFAKYQYEYGIYGWCWAKLFRKSIIKSVCFDESINLAEDVDFYLGLYPNVKSVYIDDKPYYFYRQDVANSLIKADDERIDYIQQLKIQIKMYRLLKSNNALRIENLVLCNERIKDYIYFSIYHSDYKCLSDVIDKINLVEVPPLKAKPFSLSWRAFVLWCYCNKHYSLLKNSKRIYDGIRKCRKEIKKTVPVK